MTKEIMKSHYDKELWGLTVNPKNSNQIATGGGDKTLRIWDIKKNKQIFIQILVFPSFIIFVSFPDLI